MPRLAAERPAVFLYFALCFSLFRRPETPDFSFVKYLSYISLFLLKSFIFRNYKLENKLIEQALTFPERHVYSNQEQVEGF